jgi:hypothetical protein
VRFAVWIIAAVLSACDRSTTSQAPDTLIVITPEQDEASLALKPVRDSADAVARVFADMDSQERRRAKVTSVTIDSVGYTITYDLDGPDRATKGHRVLVKRNGAIYLVGDLR